MSTPIARQKVKLGKKEVFLHKANIYKEVAQNAMDNVSKFDSIVVKSNEMYPEALQRADSEEYTILSENLKLADTAEERAAIRNRMVEMKKERYEKDTENKTFYENQQINHKNYTKQVLTSVAAVSGLVFMFRKPLIDAGKKFISPK